jgi:hypothetical protein
MAPMTSSPSLMVRPPARKIMCSGG